MSEEQQQEVENKEQDKAAVISQATLAEKEEKPEGGGNGEDKNKGGSEFVDFKNAAPEEIEKRFRRVYGHMKQFERINGELIAQNKTLLERVEAVEKNVSDGARSEVLASLKAEKKAALEAGDFDKVVDIDDKIIELRAQPEKPKPEVRRQEPDGPLNREQLGQVREWINETDADGNHIRPWAQPGHHLNAKVANLSAAVMEDPEFSSQGIDAVLTEVDRLMGKQKPSRNAATVLSGDGDIRPPSGKKTTLSADERYVASRMYPDLPTDKAEARYMEARKKWSK